MALFISRKRELRIIIKPSDRTFDEARRPVIIRGERVEFSNYRYQTNDPGLIEWLRNHPLCGSQFMYAAPSPEDTPERKSAVPAMIRGANTTAAKTADEVVEDSIEVKTAEEPMHFETPITKDEIEVMIDQKLDTFFMQIKSLLQSQAASKVEPVLRPKKTFKCPYCEEIFKSGIEVGKHKQLVHADRLQ